MSVLPDHWVKSPSMALMRVRRRMPAVAIRSFHERLELSSSRWMVVLMCANSALTNSESRSPSAWYFARMS